MEGDGGDGGAVQGEVGGDGDELDHERHQPSVRHAQLDGAFGQHGPACVERCMVTMVTVACNDRIM